MVQAIIQWYRSWAAGPYLRPWGLSTPILVLIVCLPLLRPLRQPLDVSDNELARLATIQAIVERHTLAIDETSFKKTGMRLGPVRTAGSGRPDLFFSKQPPVMAALLAGPYWVMYRLGLSFDSNLTLASYLLTLIGSTLPVALAAGLIYRLGRIFELPRPWRTTLAIATVFGSGLLSYATVLNGHAPAAALMLVAIASIWRSLISINRTSTCAWLFLAGFAASLAAVIDMGAMVFLGLLTAVILATRWVPAAKIASIGWYILGAMPALVLHAMLTIPVTGDLLPGFLHPELLADRPAAVMHPLADPNSDEDESGYGYPSLVSIHLAEGLAGSHGLLSHFPVLLFGLAGAGTILCRHWPGATKALAAVCLSGAAIVMVGYAVLDADWDQPMFSIRWFVVFTPLVMLWAGAWLRSRHHPATWGLASVLLLFSIITTLLGATAPFPSGDAGQYSAFVAARQLIKGPPTSLPTTMVTATRPSAATKPATSRPAQ